MQAYFALNVYRDDVARVVEAVFDTMLNLEVEPASVEWTPLPDLVTAAVYFAGEWKGALLLECARPQAFDFARRLTGIEMPTEMTDDVRDAMGELGNMVSGNLKSVLPRGIGLSMPSVIEGPGYSLRICGANPAERMSFSTSAGLFWVALIEQLEQH